MSRVLLFDLTRYGQPAADPVAAAYADATYPIVLDSQPGFHDGRIELVHTINGRPSPCVPPVTVREGHVIRLHVVNKTAEFHPMHLHGHTLSVLSKDGRSIGGSPIHLDSVLVGPHETWDVAFVADNPGIWMLHCHVLLHASFGMSMTVNYAGISTPYEMGSRSHNVPVVGRGGRCGPSAGGCTYRQRARGSSAGIWPCSSPEGCAHLGDDLIGVAVDVGGGEAEEPTTGVQQAVLAAVVLDEAASMCAAVELEPDPMGPVVQVRPANEAAPVVVKWHLYLRTRQPRQSEEHA